MTFQGVDFLNVEIGLFSLASCSAKIFVVHMCTRKRNSGKCSGNAAWICRMASDISTVCCEVFAGKRLNADITTDPGGCGAVLRELIVAVAGVVLLGSKVKL